MSDVGGRLGGISKIVKALAVTAVCGVILLYSSIFALKALLWALPDAPWTHHDRTHVESGAPETTAPLASANTTTVSAEQSPTAVASAAPARSAEIPTTRAQLPTPITTAAPDPASRVGWGSLWLNVCGHASTGYHMCKGSTPTDAQRAANFPPGAKDL